MTINKSTNCETLEELIELVKKLKKKANVKSFGFNGNYNKEAKIESFSVNWVEEEEV